jgi:hypothetical protein
MELPYDLKILPPQALDVLRYMGTRSDKQATADMLCDDLDLSDRAFGKVIRRLVTRNYDSMDAAGYYHLTPDGQSAADTIAEVQSAPALPEADAAASNGIGRRLVVVVPQVVGVGTPTTVYAGINPPAGAAGQAERPASLVLRLEALNGDIAPDEHTLDVPPDGAAEPVTFTLTSATPGTARVRVYAYQLVGSYGVEEAGGMYFDVQVDAAPSTELQAVGTDLALQPV